MVQCPQITSYYLRQCCHSYMAQYGVTGELGLIGKLMKMDVTSWTNIWIVCFAVIFLGLPPLKIIRNRYQYCGHKIRCLHTAPSFLPGTVGQRRQTRHCDVCETLTSGNRCPCGGLFAASTYFPFNWSNVLPIIPGILINFVCLRFYV